MDNTDLEIALVDSIAKDNLAGIVFDAGEIAIDSLLTGGIAEEVPFFGVMVRSFNALSSVREQLFAKKIWDFLAQISQLDANQRVDLLEKLSIEKKGYNQIGSSILLLMDKLDDLSKPSMIGRLFVACSRGDITAKQLFTFSSIIEKTYIGDIMSLVDINKRWPEWEGFSTSQQQALFSAGLMTVSLGKNPGHIDLSLISGFDERAIAEASDNVHERVVLEYQWTDELRLLAKILFNI